MPIFLFKTWQLYSSQLIFPSLGICDVLKGIASDQLCANYHEQYQLVQYNGESIIITRGRGGDGEPFFLKKQMCGDYYKY